MSQIGKFTQPDHSGNPRYFIEFLDMVERIPQTREIRERAYRQMRIPPGGSCLDVGCGLGGAVREMAAIAGLDGSARGVDISAAMIEEARERSREYENVEYSTGGACELPYADSAFDAVRMERVLLYVPDRAKAISELMRVTRPGGRVVITDVDIDCTAVTGKDRAQTRKMTSLIADSFVNPASGRELPGLMKRAGLQDVTIDVRATFSTHEFCVYTTQGTLRAAAEAGKVAMEEVEEWYRGLAELEAAGEFLQLWFFVIAGGTVPA